MISYIDQNFSVLFLMALINVTNLRISSEYLFAERLNSIFALCAMVIMSSMPFVLSMLYYRNIKRAKPLPLPKNDWNEKKLKRIYKTTDLEEIEKNCYTIDKYEKMITKYGTLIKDLDVPRLGKKVTMLTIIVRVYHKLIFSLSIMLFLEYPTLTIIMFTINGMAYMMFMNWYQPFADLAGYRQVMFDEIVNLIVVYHLYCLTEYTDFDQKTITGESIIFFMALQTVVFVLYILFLSIA